MNHYFEFWTSQDLNWTVQQLAVVNHLKVHLYSQSTQENLFSSYLVKFKSETTNRTIYTNKDQVTLNDFHCVSSLLWILDYIDSSRTLLSINTLMFLIVVSQREAVTHIHYYNLENHTYYMFYIDSFSFQKNTQKCHNHHKNVSEWMIKIQQLII